MSSFLQQSPLTTLISTTAELANYKNALYKRYDQLDTYFQRSNEPKLGTVIQSSSPFAILRHSISIIENPDRIFEIG
jgi:hypothetical protein